MYEKKLLMSLDSTFFNKKCLILTSQAPPIKRKFISLKIQLFIVFQEINVYNDR